MKSSEQVKWLQDEIKGAKLALSRIPDYVVEDEVVFRHKTLRDLLIVFQSDVRSLYYDWRNDEQEEAERLNTNTKKKEDATQ